MNVKINANSIKQTLVYAIAISLIALPLMASAGDNKSSILYSKQCLDNSTCQEILYAKLKDASRDMCGSSNLRVAGSLQMVRANDECYEGTLTAVVERLGNSEVKALHQQES